MIGIMYILKSALILVVMLLFYKTFLENEKMHHFNRAYLLTAILLSLIVPFLPTGLIFVPPDIQPIIEPALGPPLVVQEGSNELPNQSWFDPNIGIAAIYLIVLLGFFLKFSQNLMTMLKNTRGYETKNYKGAQIVLLDKPVSPYTFLNYIFLNRRDFENGKVDQKLLDHEWTHAKQRHSLDILFVELVMLIFWFNPVFRWYKTAIQLNHEFLADAAVIDQHQTVKSYQYLLLDTIKNNNKIYLASNINFHLTQKRLKMMTKTSSSLRKKILIFCTIPIVMGLLICCGNPIMSQTPNAQNVEEMQGDPISAKDKYFANAIIHFKTKDGMTKIISYKSLDKKTKGKLPPPPPLPPSPPGATQSKTEVEPLPKGTVVFLSEDGSVRIGDANTDIPPPPPPKPPKAVKPPSPSGAPKLSKMAKPPKPPKPVNPAKAPKPESMKDLIHDLTAPKAPPPPPLPPSFEELAESGAVFYIDNKEVESAEALNLWNKNNEDVKCIDLKKGDNDQMSVYITKK